MMTTQPNRNLETFANPSPGRDYEVEILCPEFTCLCPKTGQPDFAIFRLRYVPSERCVELKSLKLYFWSFRDEGHFHEDVTNRILDDLVQGISPRAMELEGVFNIRGGLTTTVIARHGDATLLTPRHRLAGLNSVS
jgi:7-cyano-7-deazaguanine reductase